MESRELIQRIRGGDAVAFEALYRRCKDAVHAYARSLVGGRRPEAEDLVQEAFLGFLRRIDGIDEERDPLPYLLGSVRNRARDGSRSFAARTTAAGESCARLRSLAPGPVESTLEEERERVVWRALERLPHEQAETVRLHIFGRLSHAEVGKMMGVSPATARTRYRIGLTALEPLLGRYLHDRTG